MNTINLNLALRATRTAELHFTAYTRYLPAAAELARQCDEPEWEDYDADEAQESSDTILTMSQELITGMEQHRASYCPQLPASEESDFCDFEDAGENGDILHHYSRRNRHLEESLIRLTAASMLFASYRCTAAPEAAKDADKVKQQLDRLREIVEEHIDIYGITLTLNVGFCAAVDEVVEAAR